MQHTQPGLPSGAAAGGEGGRAYEGGGEAGERAEPINMDSVK